LSSPPTSFRLAGLHAHGRANRNNLKHRDIIMKKS
jgi:hypothetical protein